MNVYGVTQSRLRDLTICHRLMCAVRSVRTVRTVRTERAADSQSRVSAHSVRVMTNLCGAKCCESGLFIIIRSRAPTTTSDTCSTQVIIPCDLNKPIKSQTRTYCSSKCACGNVGLYVALSVAVSVGLERRLSRSHRLSRSISAFAAAIFDTTCSMFAPFRERLARKVAFKLEIKSKNL